jgi:hypothetical protein
MLSSTLRGASNIYESIAGTVQAATGIINLRDAASLKPILK